MIIRRKNIVNAYGTKWNIFLVFKSGYYYIDKTALDNYDLKSCMYKVSDIHIANDLFNKVIKNEEDFKKLREECLRIQALLYKNM